MDEVNSLVVDLGCELVEAVEPALLLTPVVLCEPIFDQLTQVPQLSTVVPPRSIDLIWKAGALEALSEVVENSSSTLISKAATEST